MAGKKAIEDFELAEVEYGQYDVSFREGSPFMEVLEKAAKQLEKKRLAVVKKEGKGHEA